MPLDLETLGASKKEIKRQINQIGNIKLIKKYANFELELGSLLKVVYEGGGSPVDASNRVRTKEFVYVTAGYIVRLLSTADIKYTVYYYDINKQSTSAMSSYTKEDTSITQEGYIKVLISYDDDRDIEDISSFDNALEIGLPLTTSEGFLYQEDEIVSVYTKIDKLRKNYGQIINDDPFSITSLTPTAIPFDLNFIYGKYDELLTNYPEYATKTLLNNDSTGLPIYQYTFKPFKIPEISSMYGETATYITNNIKIPKILVTSGVHGNEQVSIWTWYNFFNSLCNSWSTDKSLEYLRHNIEFVVIPSANPSGINAFTRANVDDLNLNRNYPSDVPEHIAIASMVSNNIDADYYIDSHTTNPGLTTVDDLDSYVMINFVSDNILVKNIGANVASLLDRQWRKQYPIVQTACDTYYQTNSKTYPIAFVTPCIDTSISQHVEKLGVKSVLLELQEYNVFDNNTYNDAMVNNMALESVVNSLIGLVNNLR